MKNIFCIPRGRIFFFIVSFSLVLLSSCEKDDILHEELSNEVQLLRSHLKENGKSHFELQIQWESEIKEYKINKTKVIYVPVTSTDPNRKITLKGILYPSGKIHAFYSSYTTDIRSEDSNGEIELYINYGINGGVINSYQIENFNGSFNYSILDLNKVNRDLDKVERDPENLKRDILRSTYHYVTQEFEPNQNYKSEIEVIVSFSELDSNFDGYISVEEAEVYSGLSCHFAHTDMNGDGQLNELEYASYASSPSGCDIQLQEVIIDTSQDYTGSGYTVFWVFIYDDGHSNPGGGGGGGGSGTTNTYTIYNNIDNSCGYDIFSELENEIYDSNSLEPEIPIPNSSDSLNFSEEILHLFDTSNEFDYFAEDGTPSNPDANASTTFAQYNSSTEKFEVTTTLNNSYLETATQLSIARTIIHETVHAYLNYNQRVDPNSGIYQSLVEYGTDNGYTNPNTLHHEFFKQYIDGIAYSLYEWDRDYGTGGNLGWDYYYAMSFAGLFQVDGSGNISSETDAFKALVPDPTDRQNYADIIVNEKDGNQNSQGEKCP